MNETAVTQRSVLFKELKWPEALIFLSIVIILFIANLSNNVVSYETSDFAANGLLILDAKSLHLLVGNYSRIGFNHPGPVILYVLAFGELIFYNWLHIVKSPFAGQVIASIIYKSFWITLIIKHTRQITNSIISSILAISVFFLILTFFLNRDFLISLWFPHLYFFPFAAFLVSASRLIHGKTDSLVTIALSMGFLINGHVCFIPLTGMILFITIIFNYFFSKVNPTCACLLSKTFVLANKKAIILSLIILFLFFVPLLLQTILNFPGPVADYITYGAQHKHHSFSEVIQFVSFYWKGRGFFLTGIIISLSMYFFSKFLFKKSATDIRSMLIVLLAATFTALFYAKYGIDYLNLPYIELFYESIPAFLAALICLAVYEILNISRKKELALLVAVLGFMILPIEYYHHTYVITDNRADMEKVYQSLETVKSEGRLVLDLDNSFDWETVWGNIVGIELYAKRNKMDGLFCINKHWHILFTRSALCNISEVLTGKRFLVVSAASNKKPTAVPVIKGFNLEFYAISPYRPNQKYTSLSDMPVLLKDYLLQSGWSVAEGDFVWSDEKESHLSFQLKPNFSGTVLLDLQGYLPRLDSNKVLSVYVNNSFTGNFEFMGQNNRKKLAIPINNLKSGILDIKLVVDKVESPSDLGLSGDTRKLGIALYGLQVK